MPPLSYSKWDLLGDDSEEEENTAVEKKPEAPAATTKARMKISGRAAPLDRAFVDSHGPILDGFLAIDQDDDASEHMVLANASAVLHPQATSYIMMRALGLQAQGKTKAMEAAARQHVILELHARNHGGG